MKMQVITPTGHATFYNVCTKKGYRALWQYIKHTQKERKAFVVLPKGAAVTDLHNVTSSEYIDYD